MDAPRGVEGDSSHALREQIHQTQLQLGAKFGALEGEVRAATSQAREAIRGRIEAARDLVDIRRHVARHPWVSSAVALGLGVTLGRRVGSSRQGNTRVSPLSWARGLLAPHVASFQTMLVGRALSFLAERLKERASRG